MSAYYNKTIKDASKEYGIDLMELHEIVCLGVADFNREIVKRGLYRFKSNIVKLRRKLRSYESLQRHRDKQRSLIKEKNDLDERIKYLEEIAKANGIKIDK